MPDLPRNAKDLTGRTFGRLHVLEYVGSSLPSTGRKGSLWKCRCDCGQEVLSEARTLRLGSKKSCGCLRSDLVRQRRIDKAQKITFQGETKTIAEWAKKLGLTNGAIRDRLNEGWSIDRALTDPKFTAQLLPFRDETKTLHAWAKEFGLSPRCLRQRLKTHGWSIDLALTEPVAHWNRQSSISFQGQNKTIA